MRVPGGLPRLSGAQEALPPPSAFVCALGAALLSLARLPSRASSSRGKPASQRRGVLKERCERSGPARDWGASGAMIKHTVLLPGRTN